MCLDQNLIFVDREEEGRVEGGGWLSGGPKFRLFEAFAYVINE